MTTVQAPNPPDPGLPRPRGRRPSACAGRRGPVLVAVAATALLVDLVWHVGIDTVSGAALALLLAVLVVGRHGRSRPVALGAATLLVLIGAGTAIRTQGWLLAVDWIVLLAALPLVAGLGAGTSWRSLAPRPIGRLVAATTRAAATSPIELPRLAARPPGDRPPADLERRTRRMRGVVLAVPLVLVVGALLASADAVFASFLHVPFAPSTVAGHAVLLYVGALVGTALLLASRAAPAETADAPEVGGRHVELSIVLGGLVAVLGLFAAAQSVALVRGNEYVERTTGLTYSDYARRGFFQLLWVAAIAGAVLVSVVPVARAATGRRRVRTIVLGEVGVVLTLVVVAAAIRRLDLYQDAYGLTMLRLACTWVAILLGVAFVVIGVAIAGVGRRHRWITGALIGLLLLGVVAANVADPAAVVARSNVDRAQLGEGWYDPRFGVDADDGLDVVYLVSLGDDAVPVLLDHLDEMSPPVAEQVVREVCWYTRPDPRSVLDANLSASRAEAARREHCPPD